MVFQAIIKKELPELTGTNEKGSWTMNQFIFELTEDTPRGPVIHAVVAKFSPKGWHIDKIREAHSKQTSVEVNVSLDVYKGDKGYFNEVNVYIRDDGYRKEREY